MQSTSSSSTIFPSRLSDELGRILGIPNLSATGTFEDLWEDRPACWKAPGFPVRLNLKEVETLFHDQLFRREDLRLVEKGQDYPGMAQLLDQRGFVRANEAWAVMERGATLVLKNFDRRHPGVRDVCRQLELLLNHAAIANFYVTPANHPGLPLHQDFHDVIVCQLDGMKRWQVHERLEIPTENSPPFPSCEKAAGKILFEHTLKPGEIIYLPRGAHHRAFAQEEPSVHVTIGIHTKKWADLLTIFVEQLKETNEIFRRSLPFGFLDGTWDPRSETAWQEMMEALAEGSGIDNAVSDLKQRMLRWCSPAPVESPEASEGFTFSAPPLLRPGVAHFDPGADGCGRLHLPGMILEIGKEDIGYVKWLCRPDRGHEPGAEDPTRSRREILRHLARLGCFSDPG